MTINDIKYTKPGDKLKIQTSGTGLRKYIVTGLKLDAGMKQVLQVNEMNTNEPKEFHLWEIDNIIPETNWKD